MKAPRTHYFIEVDGFLSIESHPGPRDAACRAALQLARDAGDVRVIAIEGDDPLSESARRTIYAYDRAEGRWTMVDR